MSSGSLSALIYLFRSSHSGRPVLLLGAGASYRAGIPLAADCVKQMARASFAVHEKGMDWRHCTVLPSDWMPYLRRQNWFIEEPSRMAENFPFAVKGFLNPREFRREFFTDLIQPVNGINQGYRDLASLIQRGLCYTVLSTNFDTLIADALAEMRPHVHNVIQVNRTPDDLVRFNVTNRRQVVYLHGSVEYYRDKNLLEETQRLDEPLVRKLRPLLDSSPLIVVGYRGAELSVMQHLLYEGIEESAGYPHGIFWCVRKGDTLHENVYRLRDQIRDNLIICEIVGFDELFADINRELKSEVVYSSPDNSRISSEFDQGSLPFERQIAPEASVEDLDSDLILATLVDYCKHLDLPPVRGENYLLFMRELGLLVECEGRLLPTNACYLLFGLDASERFPFARIALTISQKKRLVFDGNLLTQYSALVGHLTAIELNPILRIKGELRAEERPAYPMRAITELAVNMLVHRDYQAQEYSHVDLEPGRYLRFCNPGGLLGSVLGCVEVRTNGTFSPVRSITELRNEFLADIFYGLGSMDKAGSGLVDVQDIMLDHGGGVQYSIVNDNTGMCATLVQPLQEAPESSRVARRRSPVELYVTNLLPFRVIPNRLFLLPLRRDTNQSSLFRPFESTFEVPIFVRHDGNLISFADLSAHQEFAERHGYLEEMTSESVELITSNKDRRRIFVWLVTKHWEFFLRRWQYQGFVIEPKMKRAFFCIKEGDRNRVTYDSRARKGVKRDVVKPRERANSLEHENEGISYALVEHGGNWALQIKPFYMFTKADGRTPIPSYLMGRRSTRRIKFDRNKNVDDDLSFWARYLSGGHQTLNIGGLEVEDLVVEFEYCSAEVAVHTRESVLNEPFD